MQSGRGHQNNVGAAKEFYLCRFCDSWQPKPKFSKDQILIAEAAGPTRASAVCCPCARLALQQEEEPVDNKVEEQTYPTLSVDARYALLQVFSGEYDDLPAFPEDVLRKILLFVVWKPAPFLADLGEELFRCTVCQRDFEGFQAAQQHLTTSSRHIRALEAAAKETPGPDTS
mmetsp:Transcript_34933/g.75278  ORF Transcript_34933/g.75278 Transcript_34933/m.75278 type:complete len:172 (+) Transcript_34933:101-616(+)